MRKAALMMVLREDGKILSVSRGAGANIWALPGGKAELGETPQENAIRECLEETGIKVKSCVHVYARAVMAESKDGEDFHSDCFFATDWSGDVIASPEGDVEWLTAEELAITKAAFPEYNKKCLEIFRQKFPDIKMV